MVEAVRQSDERGSLTNPDVDQAVAELAEHFHLLVSYHPGAVVILDRHGRVVSANANFEQLCGLPIETVRGKSFHPFVPPELLEFTVQQFQRAASGEPNAFGGAIIHRTGQIVHLHLTTLPLNFNGEVAGIFAICTDVSVRNRVESDLLQLKDVREESRTVFFRWGCEEGFPVIFVSDSISQFGFSSDDFLGSESRRQSIIHPDDHGWVSEECARYVERAIADPSGKSDLIETQEYRIITRSGEVRWVVDRSVVQRDTEGRPSHLMGMLTDITDRKKTAEALKQAKLTIDTTQVALFRTALTDDNPVVFVSENISQFGLTPDDMVNPNYDRQKHYHPDDYARARESEQCYVSERIASGGPDDPYFDQEYRFVGNDGTIRWIQERAVVERNRDGQVTHLVGILMDITDRKRIERALQESEQRYRSLFEQSTDAIGIFDLAGNMVDMNPGIEKITGHSREELLGEQYRAVFTAQNGRNNHRALTGGSGPVTFDVIVRHRQGHRVDLLVTSVPIMIDGEMTGLFSVGRDVTRIRESEARLQAILDNYGSEVYLKDLEGRYLLVNRVFEQQTGRKRDEVVGKTAFDLFPHELAASRAAIDAEVVASGKPADYEEIIPREGGEAIFHSVKFLVFDTEGSPYALCGVSTDITERKQAERERARLIARDEEIRRQRTFLAEAGAILGSSLDYHSTLNETAGLVVPDYADWCAIDLLEADQSINRVALVHVDTAKAEALLEARRARTALRLDDPEHYAAQVMRTGQPVLVAIDDSFYRGASDSDEAELLRQMGLRSVICVPMIARDRVLGSLLFAMDDSGRTHTEADVATATELANRAALAVDNARLFQEAQRAAYRDALTDMPNRALFLIRLKQVVAQGENFAVIYLDLDGFKVINDSLGHHVGDRLLEMAARRLTACVRPQDMVARLGGDEFTILLDSLSEIQGAERIADRILAAFLAPFNVEGHEIVVTPSLGIVPGSISRDEIELLRFADIAMYQAKQNGRACYKIFTPEMNLAAHERLQLEIDLRRALKAGQLEVYYQPIVHLSSGQIVGVEALVRWNHPERGMIPPAEFIPVAEETGLIAPIDEWVLETAGRQVRLWQTIFPHMNEMKLSVNLSPRQFTSPTLVHDIREALNRSGLDPWHLQLELTESTLMKDNQHTMRILSQLSDMGASVAVDDFGVGYSSLSYLKRFHVDMLKIDRAFMEGLGKNPEDTAMVRAIIMLAQALDLEVIAEGVETQEQVAQLEALSCERGQGYLYTAPLPAAELTRWIASRS